MNFNNHLISLSLSLSVCLSPSHLFLKLKTELESFDPSFFEEVEDLKFNYQEAVKKNVQYEQQIISLSQQLGTSPPSFNA